MRWLAHGVPERFVLSMKPPHGAGPILGCSTASDECEGLWLSSRKCGSVSGAGILWRIARPYSIHKTACILLRVRELDSLSKISDPMKLSQGIHAWPRRLSWHPGIQASSGARGLRNSGPNGRRQPRQVALASFDFNAHDARFGRKGWLSFLNSPDL